MNRIYVVGIGPGNVEFMTEQAKKVLEKCDVIVGYTVYVDLLKNDFKDKEFISTPMKQEIERCKLCFELAKNGKNVALVCSGDSGVYGMASPVLELQMANEDYKELEINIIPGITAANSGAALLGAPLNHDYCVISLSDLLTPWETIEKRLCCAVQADFAIAIYNPSSYKRNDYLKKACEIMLSAGASPERVCGYVENIGRTGTKTCVCSLKDLMTKEVNMFTTVFIGNSQSLNFADTKIVTKRGYKI